MSQAGIAITLDAVIVAVTDDQPRVLTNPEPRGLARIPSGPLDPEADKTLERALRRWIAELTGIEIGYAEQLYTFGDRNRGRRGADDPRQLSVAYLALVREEAPSPQAEWIDWYDLFPWEDHRAGRPEVVDSILLPGLESWAREDRGGAARRRRRIGVMFGADSGWDGIRVLDRYELLYEAGLVAEAYFDTGRSAPRGCVGAPMALDHRRIAASALGRLRGKLTYRPVVFELLPDLFTLTTLQRTVEALAGVPMHTQNFRRLVERNRLVEGTGERTTATGGRPAELFRFRSEVVGERPRPGLGVPYR
ncbi:MAG TPA: hypothetical protein VLG28_18525 [Acidimicrobiia bacterium]|nr:hypothetical protein [Acidimicrobiia bacterium]